MRELGHQLWSGGLVRVVARQAIRLGKGLVAVRLLQIGAVRIVAVETKCRSRLGQVEVEFCFANLASLMCGMAGVAAHIEGRVTAAFLWYIDADLVAAQAQILFLIPGGRLQQLVLVVGTMRIVALYAITNRWRMNIALEIGCFLIRMAGEAKCIRSRGNQLYPGHILISPNFVATGAAHGHRRMHRFAFGLVFVAGNAGGGISLGVKWHRMFGGKGAA